MDRFRGHSMQRVIIYPAYIDVKKTVAQGRRVSKSKGDEGSTLLLGAAVSRTLCVHEALTMKTACSM